MSQISPIHAPQSIPRPTRAAVDRVLFLLAMLVLAATAFASRPAAPDATPALTVGQAAVR